MPRNSYKTPKNMPATVNEPVVTYQHTCSDVAYNVSTENNWNPNVPFHGTQEEWWEHFHRIEKSEFTPLEEANREFEVWKKEFLASRLT
jgi:hypothetical protein